VNPRSSSGLDAFLDPAAHVLLVRDPALGQGDVSALGRFTGRAEHRSLTSPMTDEVGAVLEQVDAVVVVVRDRVALRRAVAAAQGLPRAERVACVLLELASQPPTLVPSPAWPRLTSLAVDTADGGARVSVSFGAPVAAGLVLAELARRTSPAHLMAPGWPVLGARLDEPHHWPPGDALAIVGSDAALRDPAPDDTADVLLLDSATGDADGAAGTAPHPVTGRVQVTRVPSGTLALGPLDDTVLNPVGFTRRPTVPAAHLRPVAGGRHLLQVRAPGATDVVVDSRSGLGDSHVEQLRPYTGVHVDWEGGDGPVSYARVVAGLAMAGVPLTADPVPAWARALLVPALVAELDRDADLADDLDREVRSIRLRRAALAGHGAGAWRRGTADAVDVRPERATRVSVLLTTRRPEMLEHALRQVGRQRGADLELQLTTHGFDPEPALLEAFTERSGVPVTAVAAPTDRSFGNVLDDGARRASGDVLLKMDDDDWYGPDFVTDLLLARSYSGADLVGCPPEFLFVEPLWVTVRRKDATERYTSVVAGGSMMVSREAYAAVGGFRDTRKYVDANLFRALRAAGGTIYRSHGLNYLLRRQSAGHTWEPGLGYFVSRGRSRQQWRGFRPSPLLEHEPTDRPARTPHEEPPG
jgi:hypothetical protein